jgi:hypothetical protein
MLEVMESGRHGHGEEARFNMRMMTVRIAHVCFQATSKKTRAERKKRAKKKRQQRSIMSQQEERTATLAKFAAKRKHESCRARSDDQKNQDRYRGRGWHRQTAAVAVSHAVIVSSCLPAGLSGSGRWGCGREGVTSQGRFAAAAVAADTVLKRCKRRAFSCRPAGFSKSRRPGVSRSHISTQFDPSVLLMGSQNPAVPHAAIASLVVDRHPAVESNSRKSTVTTAAACLKSSGWVSPLCFLSTLASMIAHVIL